MQGIRPIAMQYANAAMTTSLSVGILNTEHSIILSQTEIFKLYVFKKHFCFTCIHKTCWNITHASRMGINYFFIRWNLKSYCNYIISKDISEFRMFVLPKCDMIYQVQMLMRRHECRSGTAVSRQHVLRRSWRGP